MTSTGTMHDVIPATETEISTSHLLTDQCFIKRKKAITPSLEHALYVREIVDNFERPLRNEEDQ